jgi:acetate kinase
MSQESSSFQNVGRTWTTQGFVLALNAGASSLKFALFHGGAAPVRILAGGIDRLGVGSDDRAVAGPELEKMRELSKVITHEEVLSHIAKGSIGTNRADGET